MMGEVCLPLRSMRTKDGGVPGRSWHCIHRQPGNIGEASAKLTTCLGKLNKGRMIQVAVRVIDMHAWGDGLGWPSYANTASLAANPTGQQNLPLLYIRRGDGLSRWW